MSKETSEIKKKVTKSKKPLKAGSPSKRQGTYKKPPTFTESMEALNHGIELYENVQKRLESISERLNNLIEKLRQTAKEKGITPEELNNMISQFNSVERLRSKSARNLSMLKDEHTDLQAKIGIVNSLSEIAKLADRIDGIV